RPGIAEEISAKGLILSDYTGWQTHLAQVDYRTDPGALAEADIILLTVKSAATAAAAREIGVNARRGTLVISFQNGIGNVDVLGNELGTWLEIVRGMIPYNVAHLGGGRFHKGVAGDLWAESRPQTRALANQVGTGPASLKLSNDMLGVAWGK